MRSRMACSRAPSLWPAPQCVTPGLLILCWSSLSSSPRSSCSRSGEGGGGGMKSVFIFSTSRYLGILEVLCEVAICVVTMVTGTYFVKRKMLHNREILILGGWQHRLSHFITVTTGGGLGITWKEFKIGINPVILCILYVAHMIDIILRWMISISHISLLY